MNQKISIKNLDANSYRELYRMLFRKFEQGSDYELSNKNLRVYNKKILNDAEIKTLIEI